MATNPVLQSVLLWQHHQNTTPYLPHGGVTAAQAGGTPVEPPAQEKPFDTSEEDGEQEKEKEEDGEAENG